MVNTSTDIINKTKWFKRYGKLLQVEARLNNKLELLETRMQEAHTSHNDGSPRGGIPHTLADMIANKEELETRINNIHLRVLMCKADILKVIDSLDNPLQANVLEAYIIECKSMDEISKELGYNTQYLYRVYSNAIALSELPANIHNISTSV